MSKLIEHAAYLTQDATDPDLMVFNVPIRISKADINAGAFELAASAQNWTPAHELNAPDFCIRAVSAFAKQQRISGLRQEMYADAEAQIAAMV